jgi:hypothetical protein
VTTDNKVKTKALIEIEGVEGDMTLTITFDPCPPKEKKVEAPLAAQIAIDLVQSYNIRCMVIEGKLMFDKIRMPQLDVEHTRKELERALEQGINHSVTKLNAILEETEEAVDPQTKRVLH